MNRLIVMVLLALVAACGGDDLPISPPGHDLDPSTGAYSPVLAQSSLGQFLAVYQGPPFSTSQSVPPSAALHVQLLSAAGTRIGSSQMAAPGNVRVRQLLRVAYSPASNHFLVVWRGGLDEGNPDFPVFTYARLLDGASGAPLGPGALRVSDTYPGGLAVAHDSVRDQFLVAWWKEVHPHGYFVQRIDATTGAEVGGDQLVVAPGFGADVDVAYDASADVFFLAIGGIGTQGVTGFVLDGATAAVIDGPISITAADRSRYVRVALAPEENLYLVIWVLDLISGDADDRLYGQLLDATSHDEVGPDDFELSGESEAGIVFDVKYPPAVGWSPATGEFLATFAPGVQVQRVSTSGALGCAHAFGVDDPFTTPAGSIHEGGVGPALAVAPDGTYLSAWGRGTIYDLPGAGTITEWDVVGDMGDASSCED